MHKHELHDEPPKTEVQQQPADANEPKVQASENLHDEVPKEVYNDDLLLQKPSFNLTPRAQEMYKLDHITVEKEAFPQIEKEQSNKPWQYKARGLHGSLNSELRDLQDDMDQLTRELMSLKQQVRNH